jgi:spermidine synthase
MSAVPLAPDAPPATRGIAPAEVALLAAVFVVAACGLVYELSAGALASYLLGDSVLQFSSVIGVYLFAMGLGSWLSRFIERELVAHFLRIELLVGVIGGLMPMALFVAHSLLPAWSVGPFRALLYGLVTLVGVLVGLEVPLVMRILKRHFRDRYALKHLVSQVLTFDYLGALVVALAFPLLLVPHLGLVRTGVFFGLMNAAVAAWTLWLFRDELRQRRLHLLACAVVIGGLVLAMIGGEPLTSWAEDRFYGDHVILRESTPYQRVILTAGHHRVRLYLNGNLQFDSHDEYRYHESLVHPAMAAQGAPKRVLILGGGDGLAAREILKYPSVQQVTLVDLDAKVTTLFSQLPMLRALNHDSLRSPKLQVVNDDAFQWLQSHDAHYDVVVIDFPDPSNFSLGKLYTTTFYQLVDQHLAADGYMVVQTTSPLVARKSFWTVAATLEAVGLQTTPYHVDVPSFGEWGFILAGHRPWHRPAALPSGMRFLTLHGFDALLDFPPDMARVPAEPNRLSNQVLVQTFDAEWGKVME